MVRLARIDVLTSIVAATAGPHAQSAVPARTLQISADVLQRWRPPLLPDALAAEGAASTYDDLGSAFKQTLVMRGFAASPVVGLPQGITVLVDGIPMNDPGAGEVSFDLLPLESAQRVEVLSGTASLLGPNSLGGAVNVVTRRGGEAGSSVEVAAGSFGFVGIQAHAGGRAGDFDYYSGVVHEQEDGWREHMSGERSSFLVSFARLRAERGLRLLVFGARSRAQTAGSLPLSIYTLQPDSNLTAGDFELLRQVNLAVSGYTAAGPGVAAARWYVRLGDAERFNVNQENDPDVRGLSDSRTLGLDTDWTVSHDAGHATLDMRIGAGGVLNHTGIALHAERIDPRQTTDVFAPIRRAHAYATTAAQFGRLRASAGVRLDAIRVPFRNRLRPQRDTTSNFVEWSPRAGLTLRVLRAAQLYVSAGRSFRPPALIEIACADPAEPCPLPFALGDDPPIAPVRVTTYEAGINWRVDGLHAQLAAYRSHVRDDIFLFPYQEENEPEGSTIDGYFGNVPATRRQGVEALVQAQLPAGHRAFISYAHTRATFETAGIEIFSIREAAGGDNEVEPGSRFPLVPAHVVAAGLDVTLPRGLHAGASVRVIGEQFLRGDEANVEPPLASYSMLDVRLGARSGHWSADVIVRNAADARPATFGTFNLHQAAGDMLERFVTPASPRRLEIAIARSF